MLKKLAYVIALTFGLVACNGEKAPENNLAADASGTTGNAGSAPISAATSAPTAPVANFKEVTIPSGTTLRLSLQSAVASDTSRVEQPVRATLRSPVSVNGQVVVPAGSEVNGVVTEAEESGRVKGRARVAFRFTSMAVDDDRYRVETSSVVRLAPATKKRDAATIGIPAGAGALIGGLTKGGKGAAVGSAVGGAAGTGVVLATRGKEVHLGPGATVTTKLTAPLTVRIPV